MQVTPDALADDHGTITDPLAFAARPLQHDSAEGPGGTVSITNEGLLAF
jgi:hypothetical protein